MYDVPHKGLRNAMSQLSLLAGKTNFADCTEVKNLYILGSDVFKLLTVHAADEDEVTLAALEERCPGSSQHDMEEHEQIHAAQHRLEVLLEEIYRKSQLAQDATPEGEEFYLAFSEFHGKYLEHTAEEERVTQPLLWQYFNDEELASFRGKIMAKNPPKTLLTWFRFVIPAQSHSERAGLLGGFKKMAPAAFFAQGMQVIREVLKEEEFQLLAKALA